MAAQRRKKTTRRRGASRPGSRYTLAFAWFLSGLLSGLGISAFAFFKGYLPDRPDKTPVVKTDQPTAVSDPALIDDSANAAGDIVKSRFDFFTVLPEMEVIVPDQELSNSARQASALSPDDGADVYILQAGSFRNAADAEQRKARLALLGTQASIQVVTVNDATWHRVRIGPVQGARRTDEMRRMLQDNGIETLVMKGSS